MKEQPGSVKVSIQGMEGSFHQEAARYYFGNDTQVVCCHTFSEVLKNANNTSVCDAGIMAIENSIAGSILANYNLLRKSNLRITGEIYLHIRQNLLANHDVVLDDIHEVHSHPMALQQCLRFLDAYNWKLVETEDTALSAKNVAVHHSKHIAAIASTLAAKLYKLNVLVPDIHTVKNNYTRFLVLQKENFINEIDMPNKATITFHTDNSRGSLARVLTVIADGGIDLSKLQSFPIPEKEWRYMFGADLEFETIDILNNVLDKIKSHANDIKVYGIYKKGKTIAV